MRQSTSGGRKKNSKLQHIIEVFTEKWAAVAMAAAAAAARDVVLALSKKTETERCANVTASGPQDGHLKCPKAADSAPDCA